MRSALHLVGFLLLATVATAQEEVLVEQGSPMRFLANAADPGLALDWVARDFDDGSWSQDVYGVGYDTGTAALDLIDTPVPTDTLSIYSRAVFTVIDPASIGNLLVGAD